MKKITRIFALALAFVMAFALQAPVNAAEKAAVPVMNREMEATTMMTDVTNQNFAPYYKSNKEITYQVAVPSDVTGVQVILYNYKGKKVSTQNALSASYGTVIRYVRFKIAKNQTYTVKVRTYLSVNGTTIYGKLSKARAFTTLTNIKLKYKYNYRTGKKNYTVVMPKAKNAKGIKNFTVYISKDRSKGYKKVKTAKPGKNVKISKFKGKAIKTNQIYYIKIVPNLKCKVKSDVIYQY